MRRKRGRKRGGGGEGKTVTDTPSLKKLYGLLKKEYKTNLHIRNSIASCFHSVLPVCVTRFSSVVVVMVVTHRKVITMQ